MKKIFLPLLLVSLTGAVSAQEGGANDFNKWSVDVNGGVNKAANPMSQGYHMNANNLFHADLGFRYMFNTKFGLKLHGSYDVLNDDGDNPDREFKSEVIGIALQGYANLGRIMEFETWTDRINVLGHLGVGVSQLSNDQFEGGDRLGNFLIGLGAQYRISNRIAINADFTMINNFSQHRTWDGAEYNPMGEQGFDSTLYHATIGLSFYLGKHEKHADWYVDEKSDELEDIESRLGEMETLMNDTDKDGVPDYLDAEPNTITGVAVDSKGRTIDRNNNGVPDELESYIEAKNTEVKSSVASDIKDLINGGYVNVYFDFNKDMPNAQSVNGINFLIKYLKDNPSVNADVIGYADEIGNTEYNQALSARRAENVKQILIDAGIDGSRLNIMGNGEDTSVSKDSKYARQVVRRVTFILK
ncbi:OmpA family protein [Flavobacterium coralii]|uniref:OmpA family protein n=1 Tax=Flavobacterium coralii TaxID=2838017 RepID=UPI000C519C5E|nr:flagellar motor protein MotB [Flavobacterium sp.]|tara:strand:+ start:3892 stop:5136 length:1245 start_codon:yes stop_codon:yes gene_type:complete